MHRMLVVPLLAALLLPACYVAPAHDDYAVVPALPVVVELGVEPYYFHGGFYYYYHDSDHRWSYSRARTGPWRDLPRDHYPREVRHHGRDGDRDREHDRGRDHDRDYRY
jgi:hypothetical protein